MGIQGLLPLLKSIQKPTELKKFSGETLGVDAYGWLHRGAVSCAIDLAQGKPTRKYVDFAMHRVRMAKYFGVTPYLVFDGDFLPSKACTEASRARRREESRKTGLELLKAGKPSQAHLELQKAIDVTPEMARHLIEELKVAGVPYVVAPYEADAQLVYLERQGLIGGIISEDSDLLVFGAKRLLTKLDQHGQCIEINRRDFCACREISLTGWTDTEFRQMAILNGCDYLDGINNMGLKTAYRMIRKYKTADKVIRMLQFDGKHRMPENYLAAFKQAELTFLHQRVFCPKKRELVLLSEPQSSIDLGEMPYIGAKVDPALARAIALGDVNPISKEPILITALPQKRKGARSLATASVHKKPLGKAIDSYFKGDRRVPLGEMDPNCFAVEPKQEADMTQGGSRPLVYPLPRPYINDSGSPQPSTSQRPYITTQFHRRQTEPVSQMLSELGGSMPPSTSRRRTTGPISHGILSVGLEVSNHVRPVKKPRLCHDIVPESSSDLPQRSRFFPTRTKSKPLGRKAEANLMSDDSIEEALLSLPDVDTWNSAKSPKSNRPLEIFREDTPMAAPQKETASATDMVKSKSLVGGSGAPPPSVATTRHPGGEAVQSIKPVHETLRGFSYTPTSKPAGTARMVHGLPTPASSVERSTPKTALSTCDRLTPLQRIGAQAFQRGRPAAVVPVARRTGLQFRNSEKNVDDRAPPSAPEPFLVPLPKVDLAEVEALNTAAGSEDHIIPDSDGEDDSLQSPGAYRDGEVADRPSIRGRLNLSRYLCPRC